MTYVNTNENPIECTYEFPLEEDTLLSKLIISIEDREIKALVLEKEEAKNIYKDVKAEGNLGVLAQRQIKGQEFMSIKVGNLLPG